MVNKKPNKDALVSFASPCAGFDRRAVRADPERKTPLLIDWMETLYKQSNFSFCGVYLTSNDVPTPSRFDRTFKDQIYTTPSSFISNGWTTALPDLDKQGWGAFLIYVGYSIRATHLLVMPPYHVQEAAEQAAARQREMRVDNPPTLRFPNSLGRARGVLHANHIKSIVSNLPNVNGAVVFLDNEGGVLKDGLETYYHHLFETLKAPDANNIALRPGMYGYDHITLQLFPKHPDLFIWRIDFDQKPGEWKGRIARRP
jgi:hypothetical protein